MNPKSTYSSESESAVETFNYKSKMQKISLWSVYTVEDLCQAVKILSVESEIKLNNES